MPQHPPRAPRRLIVRRQPAATTRGTLALGNHRFPCVLGRTGITRFKREGDGATPAAAMALLWGHYRADRISRPTSLVPLAPIRPTDGWCDDARDGRYNRPVRLPFAGSHEEMARADHVYDMVIVLDWNVRRRALHRGSAIFFHLTQPDRRPTAGCIAVSEAHMRQILARIGRGTVMIVE